MSRRGLLLMALFAFAPLLAACQSPCERPLAPGYVREMPQPGGIALRFDHPSDWSAQGKGFEKPDAAGTGRSLRVEFYTAAVEKYPHIYSEGKILSGQEWGSPFPGRAVDIGVKELNLGGLPGLTVAFDFEQPLILWDGTSPVTDWGYMQFTFLVVDQTMYDIRFYASDQGQEKQIRKEFDKLVDSICVLPSTEGPND